MWVLCRALLTHLPAKYKAARQGAEANERFFRVLVRTALEQAHLPMIPEALQETQQLLLADVPVSPLDVDKCRQVPPPKAITGNAVHTCQTVWVCASAPK